ncbi:hypothetical protein SAMN05660649_03819 [Desulfotomaculum arcticum]|uniref:Uncharacterized protein n=1 Tax=Desulfotruncus arcticus DSM 17038 TaxID=1121424 RepID=A0A1I2X715_9FIRM|nr:hypothetical protein SAMN05660649_03819 [Desulfotomaculum arcticum] [Desulfotruncus arcticus DSM 17038]
MGGIIWVAQRPLLQNTYTKYSTRYATLFFIKTQLQQNHILCKMDYKQMTVPCELDIVMLQYE